MATSARYTTLIFDLGDVLFNWSPRTKTSISPVTLKRMLSTPTWFEYECGKISQDSCYQRIGNQFAFDPVEVASAFAQAQDSLQSNNELVSVIQQLKAESNGTLRVYAMSNISRPDYKALRTKPADWSIFDQVFTSGTVGERKPNLAFYRHVLDATHANPQSTIFVDDKSDNVLSARSIGLHGIIFDNTQQVARALRNLIGNPVERGKAFLEKNSKNLRSTKDTGESLDENFTQLLILEATNNWDLVSIEDHPRTWNFFKGKLLLSFPPDLDTTSIGLTVIKRDEEVVHSVLDEMMEYTNADGIIQAWHWLPLLLTYFDHSRPRFDPVVCTNVLSLFYSYGRGHQLNQTFQWVYEVLLNRAYLDGTRYYCTPESFLFFLSRFIRLSDSPELHQYIKPLLLERIRERIGANGDAMALAMRILVCKSLGISDEVDARSLLPLQCEDGGWELCWMYQHPSTGIRVGSRGLTTALAINALSAANAWPE
ncbi:hypothetical protein FGG08_006596 [Glutinoglossum americanum]|uniref:HAD-like protein n=1 Tax=Glutinoglossum americanum TaxID=1670608 RepID=A0A9P8KUT9_9PEZI|nr:hypothetical protein FGG08_006596 [Glutinoglossum americanum]